MEKENTRLKKLVADLSPENAILKEVLGKKQFHPTGSARLLRSPFKRWMSLNAEIVGQWDNPDQHSNTINVQAMMKNIGPQGSLIWPASKDGTATAE